MSDLPDLEIQIPESETEAYNSLYAQFIEATDTTREWQKDLVGEEETIAGTGRGFCGISTAIKYTDGAVLRYEFFAMSDEYAHVEILHRLDESILINSIGRREIRLTDKGTYLALVNLAQMAAEVRKLRIKEEKTGDEEKNLEYLDFYIRTATAAFVENTLREQININDL